MIHKNESHSSAILSKYISQYVFHQVILYLKGCTEGMITGRAVGT